MRVLVVCFVGGEGLTKCANCCLKYSLLNPWQYRRIVLLAPPAHRPWRHWTWGRFVPDLFVIPEADALHCLRPRPPRLILWTPVRPNPVAQRRCEDHRARPQNPDERRHDSPATRHEQQVRRFQMDDALVRVTVAVYVAQLLDAIKGQLHQVDLAHELCELAVRLHERPLRRRFRPVHAELPHPATPASAEIPCRLPSGPCCGGNCNPPAWTAATNSSNDSMHQDSSAASRSWWVGSSCRRAYSTYFHTNEAAHWPEVDGLSGASDWRAMSLV